MNHWNYRYEVANFKRHEDGSCSYTTREEGEVPYVPITSRRSSTVFMFKIWGKALELAEQTGRDAIVYAIGRRTLSRTRPQTA